MLNALRRAIAAIIGAWVFCYPAYVALRNYLVLRARSPRDAAGLMPLNVGLFFLYGAVLVGAVLYVRHVQRVVSDRGLHGRDVFTGGLFGSSVVFLLGFFGPFVYAGLTRTEVGNLTPLVAVFAFLIGVVLSVAAALMAYGIAGAASSQRPSSTS